MLLGVINVITGDLGGVINVIGGLTLLLGGGQPIIRGIIRPYY